MKRFDNFFRKIRPKDHLLEDNAHAHAGGAGPPPLRSPGVSSFLHGALRGLRLPRQRSSLETLSSRPGLSHSIPAAFTNTWRQRLTNNTHLFPKVRRLGSRDQGPGRFGVWSERASPLTDRTSSRVPTRGKGCAGSLGPLLQPIPLTRAAPHPLSSSQRSRLPIPSIPLGVSISTYAFGEREYPTMACTAALHLWPLALPSADLLSLSILACPRTLDLPACSPHSACSFLPRGFSQHLCRAGSDLASCLRLSVRGVPAPGDVPASSVFKVGDVSCSPAPGHCPLILPGGKTPLILPAWVTQSPSQAPAWGLTHDIPLVAWDHRHPSWVLLTMPAASAPGPPDPLRAPRDSQGQPLPSSQLKPSNASSQPLKAQRLLKLSSKALRPSPRVEGPSLSQN